MTSQKMAWNRRQGFLLPLLLVLFLVLACSLTGPAEPEEPTAASTETIAPPPPTTKPKPTADIAATQEARVQKTEEARAAAEEGLQSLIADQLAKVNLELENGQIVYYRPEEYQLQSSAYNTIRWNLIDNSHVGDFAMFSKITWESEMGFAGCGFVFRVGEDTDIDPWYDMIINRLEGLPYAFFDIWVGDYVSSESDPFPSSAIKYGQGDVNEVLLTGKKNEFSIYVNRKKIGVWWNAKQSAGNMGFAVYANSGLTTCKFSDSWIWEWDK
jgi:hypothetical protein